MSFIPQEQSKVLTLALETSTRQTSVCLADGDDIVQNPFSANGEKPNSKGMATTHLLPQIRHLFQEAKRDLNSLDRIAISIGPGSFTGLRLGLTAAKTIGYLLNIPLIPINTHRIVAYQAFWSALPTESGDSKRSDQSNSDGSTCPSNLASVIDAQRGQWFAQKHSANNEGLLNSSQDSSIVTPQTLIDTLADGTFVCGNGLVRHRGKLQFPDHVTVVNEKEWTPKADSIIRMLQQKNEQFSEVSPFDLKPIYGRLSAAEEKAANNC